MQEGAECQFAGPAVRRPAIVTRATNTPRGFRSSARELFRAARWQAAIDPELLGSSRQRRDPILAPTFERSIEMAPGDKLLTFLELDDFDTFGQSSSTENEDTAVRSVAREAILNAVAILSSRSGRNDDESRRLFKSVLHTLRDYWASLGERSEGRRMRRGLSLLIVRAQASLRAHSNAVRTLGAGVRAVMSHSRAVLMLTAPHPPTFRLIANHSATGPAV